MSHSEIIYDGDPKKFSENASKTISSEGGTENESQSQSISIQQSHSSEGNKTKDVMKWK
jgi:hypothetical protein